MKSNVRVVGLAYNNHLEGIVNHAESERDPKETIPSALSPLEEDGSDRSLPKAV